MASRGPREWLQAAPRGKPLLLVVDLTDDGLAGAALVESLAGGQRQTAPPWTLGCYPDVDAAARERAERAGFDLVVPRSRRAREGAELVSSLLGEPSTRRRSE